MIEGPTCIVEQRYWMLRLGRGYGCHSAGLTLLNGELATSGCYRIKTPEVLRLREFLF